MKLTQDEFFANIEKAAQLYEYDRKQRDRHFVGFVEAYRDQLDPMWLHYYDANYHVRSPFQRVEADVLKRDLEKVWPKLKHELSQVNSDPFKSREELRATMQPMARWLGIYGLSEADGIRLQLREAGLPDKGGWVGAVESFNVHCRDLPFGNGMGTWNVVVLDSCWQEYKNSVPKAA